MLITRYNVLQQIAALSCFMRSLQFQIGVIPEGLCVMHDIPPPTHTPPSPVWHRVCIHMVQPSELQFVQRVWRAGREQCSRAPATFVSCVIVLRDLACKCLVWHAHYYTCRSSDKRGDIPRAIRGTSCPCRRYLWWFGAKIYLFVFVYKSSSILNTTFRNFS